MVGHTPPATHMFIFLDKEFCALSSMPSRKEKQAVIQGFLEIHFLLRR